MANNTEAEVSESKFSSSPPAVEQGDQDQTNVKQLDDAVVDNDNDNHKDKDNGDADQTVKVADETVSRYSAAEAAADVVLLDSKQPDSTWTNSTNDDDHPSPPANTASAPCHPAPELLRNPRAARPVGAAVTALTVPNQYRQRHRQDLDQPKEHSKRESAVISSSSYRGPPGAYQIDPRRFGNSTEASSDQQEFNNSWSNINDDNADIDPALPRGNDDSSDVAKVLSLDPENALEAQLVPKRDLNDEVQKKIDALMIDAQSVEVTIKKKGAIPKSAIMTIIGACLALVAVGSVVGIKHMRERLANASNEFENANGEPLAPTSPPSFVPDLEFARAIFAPLSGDDALLDESSPQYKAVWWIVHEDPTKMMMMAAQNETQSSRSRLFELYALAVLYFASNGSNWLHQLDFLGNTSVCDWYGAVECNDEGIVRELDLDENNLNGTLPSELCALSSLERISIVGNNLHGTIPSSLGKLTRLNTVQLGENRLTGTFPKSVSDLPNLERLYMSLNELTGTIPTILSIESMSFAFNYFTGIVADSGAFPNVRRISLPMNMISGSIPKSFFSTKLVELDLWDNQFSGTLLDELVGSLDEMSYLDLSLNDMTGTIPSEIGLLYDLEYLYLDSNSFSGTIPSQIQSLTRLRELWLADNELSGNVPAELATLAARTLTLDGNNLTGSLDLGFCNQTAVLTKVDADCGGTNPRVECSCCTTCCDSSSGECTINKGAVCSAETSWFEKPNGNQYYEGAGTVCECISSENSNDTTTTWSCSDTQCQSCNRNGTVCSINEQYQSIIDDDGLGINFQSTFRYVVGRNDTVKIEWLYANVGAACEVSVNGEVCNNCYVTMCPDGFIGVNVSCENVEGAGILDLCARTEIDEEGPLVVFAFQDPGLVQGCPPRVLRTI